MSEELVMSCFQLITYVGTARSCYINAIQKAKEGKYDEAEALMKQGRDAFVQGHDGHADLLAKEANGELNAKYPGGMEAHKELLEKEGHTVIQKGRTNIRYFVKDYEQALFIL